MRKLTDLFFLTIFFAKLNMLASFILLKFYFLFLENIEGTPPRPLFCSIFQWSKGIVSRPIKYRGKLFMADGGQVIGRVFYSEG